MDFQLKAEYHNMELNFPELRIKTSHATITHDVILRLMSSGHSGYFEPVEPVESVVFVQVEETKPVKKKESAKSQPTASTSKKAAKGGNKQSISAKTLEST